MSGAKTSLEFRNDYRVCQAMPLWPEEQARNQLVTCANAAKLRYSRDKKGSQVEEKIHGKIKEENLAIPDGSAAQTPSLASDCVLP